MSAPETRRTFAIISHPDAGKTTLTEKLLLYAGAITEAGAVNGKSNRRAAASDWGALEQQRGISVSSSALRLSFGGVILNLLDTPGHNDFSEDTLRVLSAVDSAVLLIDAAKGIESQTLKLFKVAAERELPLITFVNKLDRPSLEPLALLDEIETELGMLPTPVTWPVGTGPDFLGLVDRRNGELHCFERRLGGAVAAAETTTTLDAAAFVPEDIRNRVRDELDLLSVVGATFDRDSFLGGRSTPVFFGSALTNFGVSLLLRAIVSMAPPPRSRQDVDGRERAIGDEFSALAFKVQSNVDPAHRDRMAYLRICSGEFRRGMKVVNARTGRQHNLNYTHQLFGRERSTIDEATAGDVVAVSGAGDIRAGDTLFSGPEVKFAPMPSLVPEHFRRLSNRDSADYKRFHKGLEQLAHEGVVQVLADGRVGMQRPILGAAGPMQFDVVAHRFEHEFGACVKMDVPDIACVRRTDAAGREAGEACAYVDVLTTSDGLTAVIAFDSEFWLDRFAKERSDVLLDQFMTR